jgi:hypothetical protein
MNLSDLTLENLEAKRSLADSMFWLVKAYEIENFNMEVEPRGDVESRVWIRIFIRYKRRDYIVDGQRMDIVKERLFKLMRQIEVQ